MSGDHPRGPEDPNRDAAPRPELRLIAGRDTPAGPDPAAGPDAPGAPTGARTVGERASSRHGPTLYDIRELDRTSGTGPGAPSIDWTTIARDLRMFPLDPDSPAAQRMLGGCWRDVPTGERADGVRLPSLAACSGILIGTREHLNGLAHGFGHPDATLPDNVPGDVGLYLAWDVARAPEAGLDPCGRPDGNPLDAGCDPGGGCWIATGDRWDARTSTPIGFGVHLTGDGVINRAWTLALDPPPNPPRTLTRHTDREP